jgi:hypothetical protein
MPDIHSQLKCLYCGVPIKAIPGIHRFCCSTHRNLWHSERRKRIDAIIAAASGLCDATAALLMQAEHSRECVVALEAINQVRELLS